MPDIPEFENSSYDTGNRMRRLNPRPGLEPIPALDASDSVTLQIEILKESYDRILNVILDNEWEREEGIRTVLLAGLGYLEACARTGEIKEADLLGDPDAAKRLEALLNDLASYHQQYSVMKFKAFKLYKVNQVLEFNVSGLRATERMWEGWADRMRRQHSELQAEVIRLRSLMSEFKIDWDTPLSKEAEAGLLPPPAEVAIEEVLLPFHSANNTVPLGVPPVRLSLWARIKRFFGG